MNEIRNILFTFLAAMVLYGCPAEDNERPGPGNGGIAICPSPTTIGSDVSQNATRGGSPELLTDGSTVRIIAYTDAGMSAAAYSGEGCYVMEGGALKPCATDADGKLLSKGSATDGLWLRGGASYHFFAVTPAVAVDATQTPPAANVKNLADFASSQTSGAGGAGIAVPKGASSISITLNTLQRRCARLAFAFDRVWINVVRTEIQSVKLTQMTDEPQRVSGTGNLPANAVHTHTVTLGKSCFTTDGTSPWLASGGAVVLPKSSGELDLTLSVCFNGSATPTELKATGISPLIFAKGINYTFRVKLRDGVLQLVLEIEPWTKHVSNGNAGTPPNGSGSGPWEGNVSNGNAGASPTSIVIGSWTNIVWNGSMDSGPSQMQPPGWDSNTSGGDTGSSSSPVIVSGWQKALWSGEAGAGSSGLIPPGWTGSDISGEVGGY